MTAPQLPGPVRPAVIVQGLGGQPASGGAPVLATPEARAELARLEAEVAALAYIDALLASRQTLRASVAAHGHDPIALSDLVLSLADVARLVADTFRISLDDIRGPRRSRDVARPRHIAMAALCARGRHSLPKIGRYFGDRDHTTVLHARNKIYAEFRAALAAQGWDPAP